MAGTTQNFEVFDTACGFCAVGWNNVGVTRLQLPTETAEATERLLRRRAPGARPGAPPATATVVIAAVKRYFAGERVDFSGVSLDLGEEDAFFRQVYAAARRVEW